jgi:hypothetical protein
MLALHGSFLVPASDTGYFWCTAMPIIVSGETGRTVLTSRARSFVGKDQPRDTELQTGASLLTPCDGDQPLGATLLHPTVLRCGVKKSPGTAA